MHLYQFSLKQQKSLFSEIHIIFLVIPSYLFILTVIDEFLNDIASRGCSFRYRHSLSIGWNLPSEIDI